MLAVERSVNDAESMGHWDALLKVCACTCHAHNERRMCYTHANCPRAHDKISARGMCMGMGMPQPHPQSPSLSLSTLSQSTQSHLHPRALYPHSLYALRPSMRSSATHGPGGSRCRPIRSRRVCEPLARTNPNPNPCNSNPKQVQTNPKPWTFGKDIFMPPKEAVRRHSTLSSKR